MKLLEQKELHVAMKAITKSTVVTRQRVQEMAQQAVAYSIIHGDISIGKMLLEAISVNKALRKDSLVAYFEKYGNFAWMKVGKTLKFFEAYKVGKLDADHEALIVGAKWDEAKREAEIVSKYDMEEMVRAFIGKMNKIAGDSANTVEHREALAIVEQSFVKWSAENTLKSMKVDDTVVEAGKQAEAVAAKRAKAAARAAAKAAKATTPAAVEPGLAVVNG
jgi:hypothetical protein